MIMVTSAFAKNRYQEPGEYGVPVTANFVRVHERRTLRGKGSGQDGRGSKADNRQMLCHNESAVAGRSVEDREWYFVAEICDLNGKTVDVVVMDKRTGRIRSVR